MHADFSYNWIMVLFKRLRAKYSVETLERYWPRLLAAGRKRLAASKQSAQTIKKT